MALLGLSVEHGPGMSHAGARDSRRHFLDMMGLGDFAGHYPAQLSAGMKQRVAMRAYASTAHDSRTINAGGSRVSRASCAA